MWETGVVSICLGGGMGVDEGGTLVHPLDPPFPPPHPPPSPSTSRPSSYTSPFFPLSTRSTHHPQLNGWLTQGLLGYMLRVFPHTDAHRHVCTCVPGRKWWAPLAIFVLSICYHSPPYVRPPRLATLSPFPPSSPLPLLFLFFRAPCICICTRFSLFLSVF